MHFIRPQLALFCLLALLVQHTWASVDRMQFYYHIAEGNYLIGDLGGAERGIEQMLRLDETYAPALALKSRVLLNQEKPQEALMAAEAASRSAPGNFEYQLLEALILGKLNQREDALRKINQVLREASPDSEDALVANQLKGLMNMAEGNWDAAAESFKNIYSGDQEGAASGRQLAGEAYLEKAQSQLNQGKPADAIRALDEAIALYDDATGSEALAARDDLRLLRARTLARIGETEDAVSALRQLIAQSPDNLEAVTTLASIYASTGQWESVSGLIQPIAARPELTDIALYLEGRVALARDRVGTARKKFEEAIELQNKRPTGLLPSLKFYQGLCLEQLGRIEEATAAMEDALAQNFQPETAEETVALGRMLLRTNQAARAIPILETSLLSTEVSGSSTEAWALLGRAHNSEGNTTLALSALNESLAINPNQSVARALRGSLLRRIGDYEGALADYETASIIDPSNSGVLYALALTYLQLGQLPAAEQKLGLSIQLSPDPPGQLLLHALLAYVTGASKTAAQSLDQYFAIAAADTNATAHYLSYLMHGDAKGFEDPVIQYFEARANRKQVLDWAGRGENAPLARSQICSAAFWLAQYEQKIGNPKPTNELLEIALEIGSSENPEWQFARWQKNHVTANKDSNLP